MTHRIFSHSRGRPAVSPVFACLLIVSSVHGSAWAADPNLKARLDPLIQKHKGQVAVAVKHLATGESYTHRAAEPMPTASLIKFPVMVEAYRQAHAGQLDLDKLLTLREEDRVPGSGILTTHFSKGMQLSVRDAIRLMIAFSDNTATNLVLDQIGLAATGETMERMQLPNTKIHAKVFRGDTSIAPDRSKKFGLGSTTAAEMLVLCELLHKRELVSPAASEAMLGHLQACEDKDKFTRFLPAGTKVAHKTGSVNTVRTDAGILFTPAGPIALCVLSQKNQDQRWEPDNAGNLLCAEIARAVYQHFNPTGKLPAPSEPETLQLGVAGPLVEALQRTLNARLAPSPGLSVDGDFGGATQAALVRFQKSKQLPANGIVGPDTWKALGPLVTEGPPVPEPEIVNAERLPREPADLLAGPPHVTCKAWAVGDAKTGKLLWGANESRPLDFASTTKIMTAHLVLALAETEPQILDEELVFSERADTTPGSTADLRKGERLPVRELLYGLMLPSGNDAAIALAEHFGPRCGDKDAKSATSDPVEKFVARMNQHARQLEMSDTHYANPHGLPDDQHVSSARDLLRLACVAAKSPLFQTYVSTRQHGCQVTGANGSRRNVLWKNTNQLLEIEGYGGIKTGTTTAAGACLVAQGQHANDPLMVVVLGATSSDGRYADTRNLFRWAWQQRGHRD
jgi:D-alanyl-D-alanine carboxypeptidase (penicillin-binding protein 5/6)